MAKKTKSKPKAKSKPKPTKAVAPARRRASSARSQVLPGMAQVRDVKLDHICESIGEGLDQIELGTEQVNDGKAAAQQRLHARDLAGYRHAGVRVNLVPGSEKVSVRREKEREVNIAIPAGGPAVQTDEGSTAYEDSWSPGSSTGAQPDEEGEVH